MQRWRGEVAAAEKALADLLPSYRRQLQISSLQVRAAVRRVGMRCEMSAAGINEEDMAGKYTCIRVHMREGGPPVLHVCKLHTQHPASPPLPLQLTQASYCPPSHSPCALLPLLRTLCISSCRCTTWGTTWWRCAGRLQIAHKMFGLSDVWTKHALRIRCLCCNPVGVSVRAGDRTERAFECRCPRSWSSACPRTGRRWGAWDAHCLDAGHQ